MEKNLENTNIKKRKYQEIEFLKKFSEQKEKSTQKKKNTDLNCRNEIKLKAGNRDITDH